MNVVIRAAGVAVTVCMTMAVCMTVAVCVTVALRRRAM
jgi:hypothetical protein